MQQRLNYAHLAPEGIATLRAVEHYCNTAAGLEPVLLELVRLRVSLLNGCEYCVALHSHELARHNEPSTRIAAVATWQTSDAYTQRERAALAWAEAITDIQQGHAPDESFTAVRQHFSDVEVVNLTIALASINAFNRLAIAFRPVWHDHPAPDNPATDHPTPDERSAIADDGGKVTVDEE